MDGTAYKDFKTTRGYKYHYYYTPPANDAKPVLLLLHGFPSLSTDWKHVIQFFQPRGFGMMAPDLLGYGGTDKPTDANAYRMKFMTRDIIDILDNEEIRGAVIIAHDWGSGLASRLAVYYPDRFLAYAFLAQSYLPPNPNHDIDAINAASHEKYGYTTLGYWKFFAKDGAAQIIQDHIYSFFSLLFAVPTDVSAMANQFCAEDRLEQWLLKDRTAKSFLSEEEIRYYCQEFEKNGISAPLCWYKAFVFKLTPQDDAEIPIERYNIASPVFFGAALKDAVCREDVGKALISRFCHNATVVDYSAGHWIPQQVPEKLNEDLYDWLNVSLQHVISRL